ncbi:MAG TPA: WhiB family transcriptional regulator [Micromonosporaceae bacterium]
MIDVDWLTKASCRGLPPHWWEVASFGNTQRARDNARARAICRRCPVQEPCRQRAERLGSQGMIVAGKSLDRLGPTTRSGKYYRTCSYCQETFVADHMKRIYCRNSCRVAAGNRLRTERRRSSA